MRKLTIFGDSHVNAMNYGWRGISPQLGRLPFEVKLFWSHGGNWYDFDTTRVGGGFRYHSDRVAKASNNPKAPVLDFIVDSLDDTYVFSSPFHSASLYGQKVWRKFCPWDCFASNPDLQAVSTAVLESWMEAHLRCRLDMLKSLKTHGFKIFVVEAPRPLARAPKLYAIRPDVLLSVDRNYREYVRRRLAEDQIPVILVPSQTHADGFTPTELSPQNPADPHHANVRFGAEIMKTVVQSVLLSQA